MAEATIPVDLRNPGQVFACLGLMEAAEVLCGPAEGAYAWEGGSTDARFTLAVAGAENPVAAAVSFLAQATVEALNAPRDERGGVHHTTEKWQVPTVPFDDDPAAFPVEPPESPASLPVRLCHGQKRLTISHWGDDDRQIGRDNVKFWAGAGGYPGAALARDALAQLADLGGNTIAVAAGDPFALSARQSSSFRFDWRRDYVPLDAGFSPNAHSGLSMVGFPLVELLAAIGLENARPERPDRRNKLAYRYAISSARLPTLLARAVLGGVDMGFPVRRFRIQLNWPGQEGQARCIIDSLEE